MSKQHLLNIKWLQACGKRVLCFAVLLQPRQQMLKVFLVEHGLEHFALYGQFFLAVVEAVVGKHVEGDFAGGIKVGGCVAGPLGAVVFPEVHVQHPVHALHAPVAADGIHHPLGVRERGDEVPVLLGGFPGTLVHPLGVDLRDGREALPPAWVCQVREVRGEGATARLHPSVAEVRLFFVIEVRMAVKVPFDVAAKGRLVVLDAQHTEKSNMSLLLSNFYGKDNLKSEKQLFCWFILYFCGC